MNKHNKAVVTQLSMSDTMSVIKFGMIADIQYVDADDTTDFTGKKKRGVIETPWKL